MSGETALVIHWGGNCFALWAAGRCLRLPPGRRLTAAGFCGAGFCGAVAGLWGWLLPLWARWGLVLALPPAMSLIVWPRLRLGRRLSLCAWVLGAGLLLSGGSELAFQQGLPAWAAIPTAAGLLAVALISLKAPPPPDERCARVEITLQGMRLTLSAMVDTGNLLTDPLTGLPVIVCSRQALSPAVWFPEGCETLPPGFRLLPVRTCAGRGLMACIRPQALYLECRGAWQPCQALVGVAPAPYEGMQALVPAALLNAAD